MSPYFLIQPSIHLKEISAFVFNLEYVVISQGSHRRTNTLTVLHFYHKLTKPSPLIELDKSMVHVIRLARYLWLWFQSVCPLMPSLSAYHLTWVSLTLDVGYLFTAIPAKDSCSSLPRMWGSSSQQWPQDWKRSVFIPTPKKGNFIERSNYCTIALISHASKEMLKILQARLQQYVNRELPDV